MGFERSYKPLTMFSLPLTTWLGGLVMLQFAFMADTFSTGAPSSTCWTMYPKHNGIGTQETPCPFRITVSPTTYKPKHEILVTIEFNGSGKESTVAGFQIAAFRNNSAQTGQVQTEEVVGTFTQLPQNVSAFSCFPGFQNMATHQTKIRRKRVSMTWLAPSVNLGDLTFRATIVEDFDRFWINQETPLPVDKSVTTPVVKSVKTSSLTSMVQEVDFSECGSTKSCVLYPRHCTGNDCLSAVSFQQRASATGEILVEMFSDAAQNYISVGFSDDTQMGGDETFTCVSQNGRMSIQHGWNPKYYNELLFTTSSVSEAQIKHVDGRLQCRFVIQSMSNVYRINQSAPSIEYKNITYDKDTAWYIQLAWGKSMPESNALTYHKEMPMTSDQKIHIKSAGLYRGSSYPAIVKAHAAIMMVMWIFLSGIVTVVARHYRNWFSEKRVFGTKLWFQVHRGIAIVVATFTLIGVFLIFGHYDWEIRKKSIPHSYFGLAVTVAVGLQIIGGLLRPGPESTYRPIFNWVHRILGQSSHILAAVTMFLAFDIEYINKDMRFFGDVTLGIWVAVQILCHVVFELLSWKGKDGPINVTNKDGGALSLDTILLGIYAMILVILCIACLLAFLLY